MDPPERPYYGAPPGPTRSPTPESLCPNASPGRLWSSRTAWVVRRLLLGGLVALVSWWTCTALYGSPLATAGQAPKFRAQEDDRVARITVFDVAIELSQLHRCPAAAAVTESLTYDYTQGTLRRGSRLLSLDVRDLRVNMADPEQSLRTEVTAPGNHLTKIEWTLDKAHAAPVTAKFVISYGVSFACGEGGRGDRATRVKHNPPPQSVPPAIGCRLRGEGCVHFTRVFKHTGGAPCAVPSLWAAVSPDTGLIRFLLSPKTQMLKQTMFAVCICCFCPVDICCPGGGWFSGWSRESSLTIALCLRCAETPSIGLQDMHSEEGDGLAGGGGGGSRRWRM